MSLRMPQTYEASTACICFRPVDPTQPNKLFLYIAKIHKPVKAATLAHRIKYLLCLSGIDSNIC